MDVSSLRPFISYMYDCRCTIEHQPWILPISLTCPEGTMGGTSGVTGGSCPPMCALHPAFMVALSVVRVTMLCAL